MVAEKLLYDAYEHINADDFRSATDVLESLICSNPLNIEAWEAYMQICKTCDELDFLYERILMVTGLREEERESVLDYYKFLQKKLRSCDDGIELQKKVILELVDQFNFTSKDQAFTSEQASANSQIKIEIVRLLGNTVVFSHFVLLILGLTLIYAGNDFGYWILLVPTFSTVINFWNVNNLILLLKHSRRNGGQVLDTEVYK